MVDPRPVLLISHSFGYGGDLMYFGELFAALRERLTHPLAIGVDAGVDYANPYHLDLRRLFRRYELALGGHGYDRRISLVSPLLAARVARLRPAALVTIEFTPVALTATLGSLAVKDCGRVLLVESDPAPRGGSNAAPVRAVKNWAAARADVVQTNNAAGRDYLLKDLGVAADKIRVAPYMTSRPPGPGSPLTTDGPLRLLFVNSLTERKDAGTLLDALALLPPDIAGQVELDVVGDGPMRGRLEAQAVPLESSTRFHGARSYSDLGPFFAASHALVNPTRADYRSLSSFEGLGYGLALLISRADGAHGETVLEGETGFTFTPGDAPTLARQIERLARDRALLARMRQASLRLYETRYALDLAAGNIAASIERALER